MNERRPSPAGTRYAFMAFSVALFLLFTPFEQASGGVNSMVPKYLVAAASIMLVAPLVLIRRVKLRTSSVLALLALVTIIFHSMVMRPVPEQFLFLISAHICLAILLHEASFAWRRQFESAVSIVLIVHAFFIILQALLFYVFSFGIYDFHRAVFGSHSRFAEDFLNIARFSGLQIEPGTYANYIGCLVAILIVSSDFSKRVMWTAFIAVVSIFLTNSGSSVYFVPVLIAMVAFLWRQRIRPSHVIVLAAAIALYLFFSGFITHLETRFLERDDGSLSHRMEGVAAYMATTLEEKFIGVGFGQDPCVRCYYQDIGVAFNLVTRGGIVVSCALALMAIRSLSLNGVVLSVLLFLIPLNEKIFFYEAPIWLFILFAATGIKNAKAPKTVRRDSGQLKFAGMAR
ncbi:MAG: hypothetical protein ABWY27_20715 [Telluria sp.]